MIECKRWQGSRRFSDRPTQLDVDFLGGFIDFLKTVDAGHNYPFKNPRKLAGTTIRTLYTYLRLMINHAYKEGLIIRNPTKEFSLQSKLTIEEHERAYLYKKA